MSYRIEFDHRNRIVLVSFFDIVTGEAILTAIAEVQAFLRANPVEGTIWDFTPIEEFLVPPAFFQNFVNTRRKLVAPDKPRVTVAPQAIVYGMLRMLQSHAEADGTAPVVVRSMAEACAFLKLDSPVFGAEPWGSTSLSPPPD